VTRVLLDTNALISCLISPERFGKKATEFFDQAEEVFYSSISIFEIALKQSLGKIQLPDFSSETLAALGLLELAYYHADAVGIYESMDISTNDPFDKMLISQAQNNQLKFLTSDKKILGANLEIVVDLSA
jgi:PIN domain nuclease of toxin-antitoxin system